MTDSLLKRLMRAGQTVYLCPLRGYCDCYNICQSEQRRVNKGYTELTQKILNQPLAPIITAKETPNETYFIKNTMPKYIGKAVFRPKEPKMTDKETAALTKCPHSQCFCTGKCKYGPTYESQEALEKYKQRNLEIDREYHDQPTKPKFSEGDEVTIKLDKIAMDHLNDGKSWFEIPIARIISHKPAPKPVTVKRWVNVYRKPSAIEANYINKELADRSCDKNNRIACKEIEITYFEGEGL